MPSVPRAPNIPRKIRDIKPKRQLHRNERGNGGDDEWWQNNIGGAPKSAASPSGALSRGVAESNESFGTRSRFSRPKALDTSSDDENENEANRTNNSSMLLQIWERVKLTPTRKKIKRFIAGMVLFTALKSIYFADLDDYQYSQNGLQSTYTNAKPSVSTKKMDSGLSSLRSNTDGVKSLSELLGDDYLGLESDRNKATKTIGFSVEGQKNKSTGKSMAESIDRNDFGSPNNSNGNTIQASFGKSMSGTFGSAGQNNFGYSNNGIQSASFNSFGKSMSDSFVSPNNSNMQSASFNSFSSQQNGKMQSSFHSYSDSYKQIQPQNHLQYSAFQQLPNPRSAQDSTDQLFQGLRGQSMNTFNSNRDNDRGKSMLSSSGSGGLSSDQFLNAHNTMNDVQSNPMVGKEMRSGLQCASHGGPYSEGEYSEFIYWRDIPSDASFTSPYYNPQIQESKGAPFQRPKYLTFEMDGSGWNNIRLGFENMMLLAHSMGRTLVMPPSRQIAHGMPDIHGSKTISLGDFYDLKAINAKQNGLNIITMEDFLEHEAVNGNLKSMITGEAIYPPNNQVNWNNQRLDSLWKYITIISRTFNWQPKECVLAFPANVADDQRLFSMMADVLIEKDGRPFPDYNEFQGRPVNVDAPTIERFREVLAGRRKICMYDSKMHTENHVVHFKAEENEERLILPFYAFMFWEDWRQQLFAMRFVRDNLVYNDEIFCLAARMVNAIRDYARQRSPENTEGLYDAIHIRRGDFQSQFPMTEMSAGTILAGIQDVVRPGSTIFIATDERDPTFFAPLREVYDLKFIGDFGYMLKGINPQLFGLAEQIVASRSQVFFGTYFSSFSAYIVRLRGYYSVKENQPGYESGALQNTYYLPTQWKKEMSIYQAVHVPFYAREFPLAWRDIDKL